MEILEIRDLTPEEMQELEKEHSPAAILEWTEIEVAIHVFFSIGNILSEGGWVREAISAYCGCGYSETCRIWDKRQEYSGLDRIGACYEPSASLANVCFLQIWIYAIMYMWGLMAPI